MAPKPKDFIEGKIIDHGSQKPMDYVDYLLELEYSKTPSTLIQYPPNPQEEADIAYYDELGKSLKDHGRGPVGKRVV